MGHGKPHSYTSTVEVTYGIGSDTHVLVLFFFVGSDILYVLYSTQGTCINANHRRVRLLTYEKGRQQHGTVKHILKLHPRFKIPCTARTVPQFLLTTHATSNWFPAQQGSTYFQMCHTMILLYPSTS